MKKDFNLRWYRHNYVNSNGVKIFKVSNKPWATYSKNKNYLKFINSEIIENEDDKRIKARRYALGS